MKDGCVYIKVDKNNLVEKKLIHLQDIAQIYGVDKKMVNDINRIVVLTIKSDKKGNYIFSLLKLIEFIDKLYPGIEVINLGEKDFIIHYDPPKKKSKLLEILKVVAVSFMIFFGSAFTIMTFNEDANVKVIFDTVFELIIGRKKSGTSILEISYSVGLPLGIIIFFNHFSKVTVSSDPTPLQVQMRLYEEDLDKTLIENASREDKIIDID
jgi:stage V sporulation protein AA